MAAKMGKPCPVDPIWYRSDLQLRASCQCGRAAVLHVGAAARQHRLAWDMGLDELARRLTCVRCCRQEARVRPLA
jgi:hypothetical protein